MKFKVSFSGEKPRSEYVQMFEGVGLIRGEYQIRKNQMWITKSEMQKIVKEYVDSIASAFKGKDVWYRTIEMPTTWIDKLDGCEKVFNEPVDPVVGLKGIRRALLVPETFLIELNLISDLNRTHSNLHILFPFVHDVSELKKAKEYLRMAKFNGKIGIMAEIPSTILCLEDFLNEGVDYVVVGLNDLTSFTLAARRDLPIYNNTHSAITKLLEMAVKKAKQFGTEIVVAGKHNPNSIANSERLGFDGVSIFIPDLPSALKGYSDINGKDLSTSGLLGNQIKIITNDREEPTNSYIKIIDE